MISYNDDDCDDCDGEDDDDDDDSNVHVIDGLRNKSAWIASHPVTYQDY